MRSCSLPAQSSIDHSSVLTSVKEAIDLEQSESNSFPVTKHQPIAFLALVVLAALDNLNGVRHASKVDYKRSSKVFDKRNSKPYFAQGHNAVPLASVPPSQSPPILHVTSSYR